MHPEETFLLASLEEEGVDPEEVLKMAVPLPVAPVGGFRLQRGWQIEGCRAGRGLFAGTGEFVVNCATFHTERKIS